MENFKAMVFFGILFIILGLIGTIRRESDHPQHKMKVFAKGLIIVGAIMLALAFGCHMYAN